LGADSEYEGELEKLVPAEALLVTRFDNFSDAFDELDSKVQSHFVASKLSNIERAPLIREALAGDDKKPAPTIGSMFQNDLRPALEQAEEQVRSMPLSLDLYNDLIGTQMLLAMFGGADGESLTPLILTRVSKDVRFYWEFKGWAEGQQGEVIIREDGDFIAIEKEESTQFIGLFDDVMAICSERDVLQRVAALHENGGSSFADLDAYQPVHTTLTEKAGESGAIKIIANIDAVRDWQGKDPEDSDKRAKIDQLFSVPLSLMQASQEIMPTLNTALEHAIDTRVFAMAGWVIDLGNKGRVDIDQYLYTSPSKLNKFDYLQKSWSQPSAPMDFLGYLPADTWMVTTVRQPFEVLREAIAPESRPDRNGAPDTVGTFMLALGDNPDIRGYGMALLADRYAPEHTPAQIVSRLPFPPFALFMHWPGMTLERAKQVMTEQLVRQGIEKSMSIVEKTSATGERYLAVNNTNVTEKNRWISGLAMGVIGEYFVITFSKKHEAMVEMIQLAHGAGNPMGTGALWKQLPDKHFALMHINLTGLEKYSKRVNLPQIISEQKFNSSYPEGKDLKYWREYYEKKFKARPGSDNAEVEDAINAKKKEWTSQQGPYRRNYELTIQELADGVLDFTALTDTTTEYMHTRFVIRTAP
ncbi:MAG: hypothetical protein L6Q71_04285, partial [Planctomycetes bacterium]|nr:hypothetical protein [Planctomycetota bacterium]